MHKYKGFLRKEASPLFGKTDPFIVKEKRKIVNQTVMRRKFPTYDLWSLLSPPEGTVWDYWMILLYKNKCFNKNYTYMHIRGYAVSI